MIDSDWCSQSRCRGDNKDTAADTGGVTLKAQLRVHFDTGISPVKEDLRKAELGHDKYAARRRFIANWFDEALFVISWFKGFLNKEDSISWMNAANLEILLLASPEQADNTVRLDGTSCPGVVQHWSALKPAVDLICSNDADALVDWVDGHSQPLVAYQPRMGTDCHLEAEVIHPQRAGHCTSASRLPSVPIRGWYATKGWLWPSTQSTRASASFEQIRSTAGFRALQC